MFGILRYVVIKSLNVIYIKITSNEMVTLFLEQFKSKQKTHCAHLQKGTSCH